MARRLALVIALAACRPPAVAPPTDGDDDEAPAFGAGDPAATVFFLDSAGRAVPLACAAPGVGMYLSPGDCLELLGDDREIGDLGNGRRTLGAEAAWTCMSNSTRRRALRIDASPGRAFDDGDPANDLIVWPASRAFEVAVWTHDDDPDAPIGGAPLLGTLQVDIDGDRHADTLYSVGGASGPHRILGVLSSRPDEVLTLASDDQATLQAYAALDLDGDGRVEVVVAAPYADGDWTAVDHYDAASQTLVAITGIGCGPG